ncbi:hypothetical protein BCR35DRAFT_150184 [Leucosporidium creatinivorum]|uniref:Zn(2)-C6 fungal-type domain-containing protein n=1 Tax=Leucosporidium creatinivorum TaxID=106004 RepID=A0A1Y2ENT1_9BASI|nr:hypothetical protein BCR35DRAFT_150184 [Leucosporidium creatinivorum]
MPPIRTNKPSGPPLNKGEACATCKSRKVKCDGIKPACSACKRTARFEGRDPELVCCNYNAGPSLPPLPTASPMPSTSTVAPLPALPSLPTTAYDAYNPFDYSYTSDQPYTSTSPVSASFDHWSTLPDFGATVGASLALNPSLWAFDDSTSPSISSSSPQSSHFFDDHAASPDSLHSTWSDFPPSPPHSAADDLSSCFLTSADKFDETLSLPLFPLMLPPKLEEPAPAWNWMDPNGFSAEQQRW